MRCRWQKAICLLWCAICLCACGTELAEANPTQAQRPVIMPHHQYQEVPDVDYSIVGLPEFVENISDCTDPEKEYVLPDGYRYAYMPYFVPYATNQLLLATDETGGLLDGVGYQNGARIRSILEIGECDYAFVTGFIPVKPGDIIYFSDHCFKTGSEYADAMNIAFYNADKKNIAQVSVKNATNAFFEALEISADGYVLSMKVSDISALENLAYIRFTLLGKGEHHILSVNETLEEGYEAYVWTPVEPYLSSFWCEEIAATIETIKGIKLAEKESAICFLLASDIHLDPNATNSYTEDMGKVCAEVMRACGISFFATAGDNCTQSSGFAPSDFEQNMEQLLDQLMPIPHRNILMTVGNHDGATGQREVNGEILYYRHQLNNEERSAVFFDWQRASNPYKTFDSDGTYYYLDDAATKTRYVFLNSFWSKWDGEEDGFVPDIQHGFMQTPIFGPQQLEWFAAKALDMPPDYGAVIITHNAPVAKDFAVFQGILDAFNGRTTYAGAYVGAESWQSTEIAVNYRYAEGEIVAVFQGHNHADGQFDYFLSAPCIEVTTAGAFWAVRDENAERRIKGTSSEFAVDVVIIDRSSRTIYLIRLGAGEDRIIYY